MKLTNKERNEIKQSARDAVMKAYRMALDHVTEYERTYLEEMKKNIDYRLNQIYENERNNNKRNAE
jgi:tartrate dehydratase alpha subunit/fumarate hydratase class I-like protein